MRPKTVRLFPLLALASLSLAARAEETGLTPGQPAPAMEVKTWLKGTPIDALRKDETYVVEFWATWCGPCLQSIPHLTELAKANRDVTFVGVSVWEDEEGDKLPKFVADMGDKMDYHVGYSGNKTGMAASWMAAAAQNGIPTAFVVKNGIVQWVGHPMLLDKPLAEIKAGTFDLAAHKAAFEKQAMKNRRMTAAYEAIAAAQGMFDGGRRKEAQAALDAVAKTYPEQAEGVARTRFDWLAVEDPKAWEARMRALVAGGKPDDAQMVLTYALHHAADRTETARAAIDAVLAAKPDDYTANLYAFNVFKAMKDDAAELKAVDKLLALLPTSPAKANAAFKANLTARKAELEAATKAKEG